MYITNYNIFADNKVLYYLMTKRRKKKRKEKKILLESSNYLAPETQDLSELERRFWAIATATASSTFQIITFKTI